LSRELRFELDSHYRELVSSSFAVEGFVAPGFEAVAEEFRRNLHERGELGAAFSASRGPEPLVDIWGGIADRTSGALWRGDTLPVVFSGTKGFVAVCLLKVIERGLLDLEEPVARYWPEFAAAGKDRILVRDVVSHMAGLPVITTPLQPVDLLEPERMTVLLATQEALPSAGVELYYHALTFGWLCGELVRRVDGRSVGRFFSDEISAPLDLELWIGLPAELEHRVAALELGRGWGSTLGESPSEVGDRSMLRRGNPPVFERGSFPWNSQSFHTAEIAGAGAIGTARSIARLYSCLAAGGEIDGIRILDEETVLLGRKELSRGHEAVVDAPLAFGVGFELQTERRRLGPPRDAFGHTGAGGSVHGAWPTQRVGFSYAMNLMRDDAPVDERAAALLRALYEATDLD
jgi:CubicO group peptidase (beta-lactamase class C family)